MVSKRIIVFFTFLCLGFICPSLSFAQYNGNGEMGNSSSTSTTDAFYKNMFQAGAELTYPIGNKAMTETFAGIYAANASLDFSILKRLFVGVEIHDDEFAIAANPLYNSINPRLFNYYGGLRVGYHSGFIGANDFVFCSTFTGGEALMKFTNALIPAPKGGFVQKTPCGFLDIAEYYRISDQMWAGLNISLTYCSYNFNPDYIGLESTYPYLPSDSDGPTMYIGWGFQLLYVFAKK